MSSESQSLWLIKSSGRILGPHSIDEVGQMIRSKEIVIIDEVSEPLRRWQMIRDHIAFTDLIERLRQEGLPTEEITTNVGSITGSLTESIAENPGDEATDNLGDFRNGLKEIVYESDGQVNSKSARPLAKARFQSNQPAMDWRIRKQAERSSRWMWGLTFLVLIGVVAVLAAKRFQFSPLSKNSPQDQLQIGFNMYQDGDYLAAMSILKKVYNDQPERKEVWLPLALMMIQVEGRTLEGRRLLQNLVAGPRTEALVPATIGLGLSYLSDGDFAGAATQFNRALQLEPRSQFANANMGVLHLLKKDLAQAISFFSKSISEGSRDGAVLLQMVTASIFQWKATRDGSLLADAKKLINSYLQKSYDFEQELQLALGYIELLQGDVKNLDSRLQRVLDVDPQQTEDFRRPILLARQMADWTQLRHWCEQLVAGAGNVSLAAGLQATCRYRIGQYSDAKTSIEKAVNQAPRDALLQAIYASVLRSAGLGSEASVAIGRAVEMDKANNVLLPLVLQARFCQERGDFECANSFWLKALEIKPSLPAAKVGIAVSYHSRNKQPDSTPFSNEVNEALANYKPLLQFRRQIGAKAN
jgi:Tfp pilus assembly protein PilF